MTSASHPSTAPRARDASPAAPHVLMAVLPERGHIHPFLGAAEELRARGARVSFWAPRDVREILGALGWAASAVHAPDGAPPPAADHRGAAFAELLADPARLRAWIRAMLVDAAPASIAPLRAHISRTRPDVVVIDPMAYAAAIAAEAEGVPWLGLSTSLNPCIRDEVESELVATLRELDPARRALFRAHGMDVRFRVSDVLSPRGTFVLSTAELVGAALPDDGVPVHLVGAALPPRAASEHADDAPLLAGLGARPDRPLVYASFGSQAYHQPAHLRVVIEAARSVEATFVIAMGELASSPFAHRLPENVVGVGFAPQLELLSLSRVAITHGGANSVHEGLAFGVPLVVSAICNDQHHNATLVEASGAGRSLDLAHTEPGDLAAALRAMLAADAPERVAAARIARAYGGAGGAARVADIVWSAAAGGRA